MNSVSNWWLRGAERFACNPQNHEDKNPTEQLVWALRLKRRHFYLPARRRYYEILCITTSDCDGWRAFCPARWRKLDSTALLIKRTIFMHEEVHASSFSSNLSFHCLQTSLWNQTRTFFTSLINFASKVKTIFDCWNLKSTFDFTYKDEIISIWFGAELGRYTVGFNLFIT